MGLIKRISDGFWAYMSPAKANATQTTAPQTEPRPKKRASAPIRRNSMKDIKNKSRSMSPEERISDWRKRSSTATSQTSNKRKRGAPPTPSSGPGRRKKVLRMEDVDMSESLALEDGEDSEAVMSGALVDDDDAMDYEQNGIEEYEEEELEDDMSAVRSSSPIRYGNLKSPAVDETEALDDESYTDGTPQRRRIVSAEQIELDRGFSPGELRDDGWDDDHITLVEKLTLRGFEPVLPKFWHMGNGWLPEGLFVPSYDDESFISSIVGDELGSERAFFKMLEMSSRIRDGIHMNEGLPSKRQIARTLPEAQGMKHIKIFTKWCDKDSGLDLNTAIPILCTVARPRETAPERLQYLARRRLQKLAARWKEAFKIRQSVEDSPRSHASTVLTYPIPTLYCLIASHNLVALVALRPEDSEIADESVLKSVLLMDNNNQNYDFWNALAIAIIVCHVRNVRVRIAEETGIGVKVPGNEPELESDPDL